MIQPIPITPQPPPAGGDGLPERLPGGSGDGDTLGDSLGDSLGLGDWLGL